MNDPEIKQNVRAFYDQIGWKKESDGYYQNARYEDLRPVSAEYIHRCHMRITPYFSAGGKFFLDAGSGPVQYPEYLTYSMNFEKRVCADISITALIEARKKIGAHGLFVVADVANLPFSAQAFDGIVSLHTLHHLPLEEQKKAWLDLIRVLAPKRTAVVVNGWTESGMMKKWQNAMGTMEKIGRFAARIRRKDRKKEQKVKQIDANASQATGTFVQKLDAAWIKNTLRLPETLSVEIRCWRSVSVRWLRAMIHQPYGKLALRILFRNEEKRPEFYGEYGQYPLIIVKKIENCKTENS